MSHRSFVRMLAVAAAAAFVISACGSSPATTSTNKVKKLAFFGFAAANSFAQATWAGGQESAQKAGVEAKFFDPNFDSTKQVAQIQNATASCQYQADVVESNAGTEVVRPISDAITAGIAA